MWTPENIRKPASHQRPTTARDAIHKPSDRSAQTKFMSRWGERGDLQSVLINALHVHLHVKPPMRPAPRTPSSVSSRPVGSQTTLRSPMMKRDSRLTRGASKSLWCCSTASPSCTASQTRTVGPAYIGKEPIKNTMHYVYAFHNSGPASAEL